MDGNKDARDAFGGDTSNANAAFGGGAVQRPPLPPPVPVAAHTAAPLPMQAFSDLGQAQQPLTQADTSLARANPPDAVAALVLAILGLLLFPAAIAGAYYARKARATAKNEPGRDSTRLSTIALVIAGLALLNVVVRVAILFGLSL